MKNKTPLIVTAIYFAFAYFGISNHEMWLDEAQHILLAKNSSTISELIYNARYEGHPLLWNILLFFITHLTSDIFYVQLFHILITGSCIYLVSKHAPFSFYVKLLICFGYFLLYEYSLISRNYSLSLLFILLIVIHISSRERNYLYLFLLLSLLFNTHLFSCVISISFLIIIWKDFSKQPLIVKTIYLLIFLSSLFLCFVHIIPPNDHFMNEFSSTSFFSYVRIRKTLGSIVMGILPIPDLFQSNYWNNNFLLEQMTGPTLLLATFLFLVPFYLFKQYKSSLFIFYSSSLIILLFIYVSPLMVANRHCGFFSVLLLTSAWLSKTMKQSPVFLLKKKLTSSTSYQKFTHFFFGSILFIQLLCGISFFYLDLVGDFSASKKAGHFLNEVIHKDQLLALSHFTSGPALSLYTKSKLFYIEPNAIGTFCIWNTRPISITDSVFLYRLDSLLSSRKQIILINTSEAKMKSLVSKNKQLKLIDTLQVKHLASFKNATIKSECYFVYRLSKKNYLYGTSK